jgi:hypothetical protein
VLTRFRSKIGKQGGIVCAVLFLSLGSLIVDYAGIQTDEALFAAPLFRGWRFNSVQAWGHSVPVMNMTYLGALKTWL